MLRKGDLMFYRDYGKTGVKVSILGFGCMRLPEYEKDAKHYMDEDKCIELLQTAYINGINYYDTAPYYCHSNSEYIVGKALKPYRNKVFISTKCPCGDELQKPSDYRKQLEQSLKKLDTDYIDFYHFWSLNKGIYDNKVLKLGLLKEARKAKEEGLIKHISFSFHDKPEYIKYIIDTAEIMETMLVQYNLLDRSCEEMIAYAASKGLGVAAMGPVGGGRLAAPTDLYAKLTGKPSIATYELAFKFVLGNPNINCALSGMQDLDMLHKNLNTVKSEAVLNQEEWEQISQALDQLKKFSDLYCTGCGYCQPCPAEINIPHIFNLFTYHNVYGLTGHAKNEFMRYLEKGKTIKDCEGCGYCESKCPQKLKIRRELARVEKVLTSI